MQSAIQPSSFIGVENSDNLRPFSLREVEFTFVESGRDDYENSQVGIYRLYDGRYVYLHLNFDSNAVCCYASKDFEQLKQLALTDSDRERLGF